MTDRLTGSTLIDQFEHFEIGSDLKNATPREARLGRWVLLYGVLQVLSTLSVDVQSLKHTDGVRYFLCTDLKRCPEWVTNGQAEYLEASQQRSWCWQRAWDPMPFANGPVELEGSSMPLSGTHGGELEGGTLSPNALDGATMLQNDIRRISEKIDNMGIARHDSRLAAQRELEIRRENEKVMQNEFASKKIDNSYRLTESDYVGRPLVPTRNPLRSPPGSGSVSPREQMASPRMEPLNGPQGYPMSPQMYSVPPPGRGYYDEGKGGWR